MKEEILRLLREADGFVSGQQLCEKLAVSRTAVWKAIGQLKNDGYEIEAVTNKGYRLLAVSSSDTLSRATIESRLHTAWAGRTLICKDTTGSTNDDAQTLADKGYAHGTLVVAGSQTAGKGRRGRSWISPEDVNVYMSILLRPAMPASCAPMCTLVMALAVYEAMQEMEIPDNVSFGIKWPNDIVVSTDGSTYRKICGILTQMRMEDTEIRDVIIGTGININMTEIPEEIQSSASSLKLALGRRINRAALTASCWNHFEEDYEKFASAGSLAPLAGEYEKALVNVGRKVRVLDPKGEFTGTAGGITDTGELIVRPDGSDNDVYIGTGEISVRGVMGYV